MPAAIGSLRPLGNRKEAGQPLFAKAIVAATELPRESLIHQQQNDSYAVFHIQTTDQTDLLPTVWDTKIFHVTAQIQSTH